jgi:hypothetical protein
LPPSRRDARLYRVRRVVFQRDRATDAASEIPQPGVHEDRRGSRRARAAARCGCTAAQRAAANPWHARSMTSARECPRLPGAFVLDLEAANLGVAFEDRVDIADLFDDAGVLDLGGTECLFGTRLGRVRPDRAPRVRRGCRLADRAARGWFLSAEMIPAPRIRPATGQCSVFSDACLAAQRRCA